MDKSKKKELIEKVAHGLDITPDMYNRSESVVRGISAYLKNIDPSVQVYKQGSFKLGTIVRPYSIFITLCPNNTYTISTPPIPSCCP